MPHTNFPKKDPEKSDVLMDLFCFGLVGSGAVAALIVDKFFITPLFGRGGEEEDKKS